MDGDAAAVAAGFEPISNPSAAQIAAKLALARTEAADVAMSDREHDEAQQAVTADRVRAEALAYEIMDQLRFHLRRETLEGQRRIMRTYGAAFTYAGGELVDAEDQPPPAVPDQPAY